MMDLPYRHHARDVIKFIENSLGKNVPDIGLPVEEICVDSIHKFSSLYVKAVSAGRTVLPGNNPFKLYVGYQILYQDKVVWVSMPLTLLKGPQQEIREEDEEFKQELKELLPKSDK